MRDIIISGEHIVHGIYITVIVILAVALIFKSSNGDNTPTNDSEDDVQILKDASVTIIKNTNLKPPSTVTIPETSNGEQDSTPEPVQNETEGEDLLPITGQLSFSIDKITKEVKGEDWGKVTTIKFTITNQKPKSFYPKVLIYLWDDNDGIDARTYVEEEIYFNKLESGESITEEKDVSISFNEIDKEKTLKAILYDEDDEELDIVIEKFTLS